MNEKLKQEHLAKKHNLEGYYNEECILCVNRKQNINDITPNSLGVNVKEQVVSKDKMV